MPLSDVAVHKPVTSTRMVHKGMRWDLLADEVDLGGGESVTREYVRHPGAVAIIALDENDRVLLQSQYRHPVQEELWEPPAGLLDVVGEDPLAAARRELWEEADLTADRWHVLVDYYTSPGMSSELIRVFLARTIRPAEERFERSEEERTMEHCWLPLSEAERLVLVGMIHNPSAVVGILAAASAKRSGWATLRSAHAPWPTEARASIPHPKR